MTQADEEYAPRIGAILGKRSVRTRYETGVGALDGALAADAFHTVIAGGYLDATYQVSTRLTCKRVMGARGDLKHWVWEDLKGGVPEEPGYIVYTIEHPLPLRLHRAPPRVISRKMTSRTRGEKPWSWVPGCDRFEYVMKSRHGLYVALSPRNSPEL
jgi:hypothetical protein